MSHSSRVCSSLMWVSNSVVQQPVFFPSLSPEPKNGHFIVGFWWVNVKKDSNARKARWRSSIHFSVNTSFKQEQNSWINYSRIIQYVERQVVLFDALEDAAFTEVRDVNGAGSLRQLELEVCKRAKNWKRNWRIFLYTWCLQPIPHSFIPGTVLQHYQRSCKSAGRKWCFSINMYPDKLGKTPFL